MEELIIKLGFICSLVLFVLELVIIYTKVHCFDTMANRGMYVSIRTTWNLVLLGISVAGISSYFIFL